MCGIFGYIWKKDNADKILLHWLERLEYRGYDSAWLFVWDDEWNFQLIKSVWKVWNLVSKVQKTLDKSKNRTFGIAHTRWATHGWISEENTHPHHDMNNNFVLVHNGIIENYYMIKKELEKKWYKNR